ncbi:MAG: hypothetical protein WBR13_03685 [Allosphingosinicella sp.]
MALTRRTTRTPSLSREEGVREAYAAHGGELTRHHVETAEPIGSFTGWTPARAVVQWAYLKPAPASASPAEPAEPAAQETP